jgi:hypothetical protein
MIHAIRRSLGERLDQVYYALLRTTVTRLFPAAIQFDEQDPILGAGFRPHHRLR